MWRAEFKTALKYTGLWLAMVALAGAVSLVGMLGRQGWTRTGLLFYMIAIGLILIFPVLLGYSAFSEERAQRGMEYALSLPLPRRRLLAAKLVPRLAVLVFVSTLFLLCLEPMRRLFLFLSDVPPAMYWGACLVFIGLFVLSLPFSLWQESILFTLILTVFSLMIYVGLVALPFLGAHFALRVLHIEALPPAYFAEKMLGTGSHNDLPSPLLIVVALILLVAYFLAFILMVRTLDLRPRRSLRVFATRLGWLCLAGAVVSATLIGIAYKPGPADLELIDDLHMVETKPGILSVRTSAGERYYFPGNPLYVSTIGSDERDIYFLEYGGENQLLLAFRKDVGKWRMIYAFPSGHIIRGHVMLRPGRLNFIIGLSDKKSRVPDYQLITLDPETREIESCALAFPKKGNFHSMAFLGTDLASEKRFWLLSTRYLRDESKDVYRIWEDGRVDVLPFSENIPIIYFRKFLFALDDQEMVVRDALDPEFRIVRKIEGRFSYFVRGSEGPEVTGGEARLVVYDQENILYCIDLSDWSLSRLENAPKTSKHYFYRISNNLVSPSWLSSNNTLTMFRLIDCRLEPFLEIEKRNPRRISDDEWLSNAGVVVRRNGKIRAYAAPDMKEIRFK